MGLLDFFKRFTAVYSNRLYEARSVLLQNEPFYAYLFQQCTLVENSEVKTISIREKDNSIEFVYCEDWINTLSVVQVIEVIKHVLDHFLFGHLGEQMDKTMGTAEDLAINTWLNTKNLPPDFPTPEKMKFAKKLSSYEYYRLLPKDDSPQSGGSGGNGGDSPDSGNSPGNTNDDPNGSDNHSYMTKEVSQSGMESLQKAMVGQAYSKSGGKLPNSTGSLLSHIIEKLLIPTETPWFVILRRFVAFASKVKSVKTWKRVNRRFGEEAQGQKKVQTLKICVAIDESGSVGDEEWKAFSTEILSIQHTKMAVVTVIKFTSIVEKVFELKRESEMLYHRYSGGTNFQPVLTLADEMGFDALLIFTDGYNSEDDQLKFSNWKKVLWCLTPNHRVPMEKISKNIVLKPVKQ